MSSSPSLYNVEIELGCLAVLLQFPDTWADFYLITENDFSPSFRPIWETVTQQLNQTPPGSISPLTISDRLKAHSIKINGVEVYDVLNGLMVRFVQKSDASHYARDLKRIAVRRELIGKAIGLSNELIAKPNATFEELTSMTEKALSSVNTDYFKEKTPELFSTMIQTIEEQGDHPLKEEDMGYLSPFASLNQTLGPLSYPSAMTLVGARTGGSKSALAWYYNTYVAEKSGLVVLHLDAAEMSEVELIQRAVCCLSKGRVPLWAVTQQRWKENPTWVKIIREECWPRVQKMMKTGCYYQNIGGMSGSEIVSFIRRFYYNKVGIGNHLLINLDYIKGTESFNANSKVAEHQAIGNFIGDLKSLISNEITASVFTSVQLNRTGIVTGKKMDDIIDSDASYSLSDRIIQQATHGFIMRYKIAAELAQENSGGFGNLKLLCVKKRRVVGRRGEEILRPVKLPSGGFTDNYFNLNVHGFHFEDKGLMSEMLETLGRTQVNMKQSGAQVAPPL